MRDIGTIHFVGHFWVENRLKFNRKSGFVQLFSRDENSLKGSAQKGDIFKLFLYFQTRKWWRRDLSPKHEICDKNTFFRENSDFEIWGARAQNPEIRVFRANMPVYRRFGEKKGCLKKSGFSVNCVEKTWNKKPAVGIAFLLLFKWCFFDETQNPIIPSQI